MPKKYSINFFFFLITSINFFLVYIYEEFHYNVDIDKEYHLYYFFSKIKNKDFENHYKFQYNISICKTIVVLLVWREMVMRNLVLVMLFDGVCSNCAIH